MIRAVSLVVGVTVVTLVGCSDAPGGTQEPAPSAEGGTRADLGGANSQVGGRTGRGGSSANPEGGNGGSSAPSTLGGGGTAAEGGRSASGGSTAASVDECALGTHNCSTNADCLDTDAGFRCSCRRGFLGDGVTCTTAPACTQNDCKNGGTCMVTDVGAVCNCTAGYGGVLCEKDCSGIVTFADAAVDAAVRQSIGVPSGDLRYDDVKYISSLSIFDGRVASLTGLECLTGLTWLSVVDAGVTDLAPLSGLTKLTHLNLECNDFTDLSALSRMSELEDLNIGHSSSCEFKSRIADLAPLAGLSKLASVAAYGNAIVELTPLQSKPTLSYLQLADNPNLASVTPLGPLTNLSRLGLSSTRVKDCTALATATALIDLDLTNTGLTSLDLLPALPHLKVLDLAFNTISDISKLAQFTGLEELYLDSNSIVDLSPLVNNAGLASGDLVSLYGNAFVCAEQSSNLTALKNRGAMVYSACP